MDTNNTTHNARHSLPGHWWTRIKNSSLRPVLLPSLLLLAALQAVNALESQHGSKVNSWLVEVQRGDLPQFFASVGRLQGNSLWDSCTSQELDASLD